MTTRKEFLKTIATGALMAAAPSYIRGQSRETGEERPNILWITMEDTSMQFIGCYGNAEARTPHMDRLASEGVRFTSAFSVAPVCSPSRSCIITGCLPEIAGTGHHRSDYEIPGFMKGFPYYLRQAGYYVTNNLKTDYNVGNKGFIPETWDECFGAGGWGTAFNVPAGKDKLDTWDENAQEAGWWHRKPGQPFFSVFNLFNTHQSRTMTHPYAWYEEKVLRRLGEADRISPDQIKMPPFYRDTPSMRRYLSRVYNSIRLADQEFGHIVSKLEQDGLRDSTIIFCFADHGEGIPKGKMSALGLGFQVPFFAYFPPRFQHLSPWPARSVTDELVSSSEDVAPTMLSIAGLDIPPHMTGRPLAGTRRQAPRPYVWGARNRIDESPDVSRTVTDGRYFYTRVFMPQIPLVEYAKYQEVGDITREIRSDYAAGLLSAPQAELVEPRSPEYLYDLHQDPWQIHNLASNPGREDILARMRSALHTHLLETRDVLFMPEYEMAQRTKSATPYAFRKDAVNYPFPRVLDAAMRVGQPGATQEQLRLLRDKAALVRYWAAVGLDAAGEEAKPFKAEVLAALEDPHPSVRIVMSGVAFKLFESEKARRILEGFLKQDNEYLILHSLQTIEYMQNRAMPFAPALYNLLDRFRDKNGNLEYDINCIAEVVLHFLKGDALYYQAFAKWTPAAQMQKDPEVHF